MIEYFKGIQEMIRGDARFMRRVNGWLAIFWIIMIPVSLYFGWLQSVTFVSALSLWALVSGHWSAWQASRVEVEQQKEERRDNDGRIARRVIKESNLRKTRSRKGTKVQLTKRRTSQSSRPAKSRR